MAACEFLVLILLWNDNNNMSCRVKLFCLLPSFQVKFIRQMYTCVNFKKIFRCANQPVRKFKLGSHGFITWSVVINHFRIKTFSIKRLLQCILVGLGQHWQQRRIIFILF